MFLWRTEENYPRTIKTTHSKQFFRFIIVCMLQSRPGYLIPFFCLQVFDFCLTCLTVVGYMSYAPNVKLWIIEQGLVSNKILNGMTLDLGSNEPTHKTVLRHESHNKGMKRRFKPRLLG